MALPLNHPITRKLAEESYERYRCDYGSTHRVELASWDALDHDIRKRWCLALAPVAEALQEIEPLREQLQYLERRLSQLEESDDRASSRLAELGSTIRAAHRELPDMAALGTLPPAFVQVISNVRTALETASPAN